ncbi:hypothetical protein B0H63DRAFT_455414 [Podospora didyma]|uniref:NACHT domain-containing protein n=1 Tax=Podospora didyma TaxID=330526 RepID=A0AAE0K3C4_9PEZI|nr:hypothetical protein B0H63DRAFT_455414 [Podospora didyma]
MADPISALSLAAAVVQFVDFSRQIVCKSKTLYRSTTGVLRENLETETVTMRLREITDHLRATTTTATSTTAATYAASLRVEQLRTECFEVSDKLMQKLHQLRVPTLQRPQVTTLFQKAPPPPSEHRAWKSFRQALKSVWSKAEIDGMASRLAAIRAQLDTEVLVSSNQILISLAESQSSKFQKFEDQTQAILRGLAECRTQQTDLVERFDKLGSNEKTAFTEVVLDSIQHSADYAGLDYTTKDIIRALVEQASFEVGGGDSEGLRWRRRRAAQDLIQKDTEKRAFRARRVAVSILESLRFPEMNHRQESISQAEHQTFNWVFEGDDPVSLNKGDDPASQTEEPKKKKPWDSFSNWLSTGSGIYWIQGKPASGKSTLMRFICEHSETSDLLRTWAFGRELLSEQRSHSGLLRTLLYSILYKKQDIMFQVFPEEWERNQDILNAEMPLVSEKWSLGRLKQAFRTVINLASADLKMCCFIDGLDEYDGDAGDIADYIYEISTISPNVKFCISGRPLSELQATFWDCPGLRLQDLTEGDIQKYVHQKLGSDRQMQRLSRYDKAGAEEMFDLITKRASGVFLWVVLVVRSLVSGLRHGDNIPQLRARLNSLPVDLERLFEVILGKIEAEFKVESSKVFQIFRACGNDLDALELYRILLYEDYESLIRTDLEPDDDPDGSGRGKNTLKVEQLVEMVEEQMALKLSSRCRGLLEIRVINTPKTYYLSPGLGPGLTGPYETRRHLKIEYLHRTARDFVERREYWSQVIKPTEETGFDPHAARLLGYVAGAKLTRFDSAPKEGCGLLRDIAKIPLSASLETVALLDELDRILSFRWKEQKEFDALLHWSCAHDPGFAEFLLSPRHMWPIWGGDMVSAAVRFRLLWYAEAKLGGPPANAANSGPIIINDKNNNHNNKNNNSRLPFLAYAVSFHLWAESTHLPLPNLELLEDLLALGYDPNEKYYEFSIWAYTVHRVHTLAYMGFVAAGHLQAWLEVFMQMLSAGADPHVFCVFNPVLYALAIGYSSDPDNVSSGVLRHFGEVVWSPDDITESVDSDAHDYFAEHHRIDKVISEVFDGRGVDTTQLKITLATARDRWKGVTQSHVDINLLTPPEVSTSAKPWNVRAY